MFEFFEEIAKKTDMPYDYLNNGFKVINFNNNSVFIEGFTNLVNVTKEELCVKLKKGIITIKGEHIQIKNMDLETIVVVGKITSIEIC